jgi:hypothetical protein
MMSWNKLFPLILSLTVQHLEVKLPPVEGKLSFYLQRLNEMHVMIFSLFSHYTTAGQLTVTILQPAS